MRICPGHAAFRATPITTVSMPSGLSLHHRSPHSVRPAAKPFTRKSPRFTQQHPWSPIHHTEIRSDICRDASRATTGHGIPHSGSLQDLLSRGPMPTGHSIHLMSLHMEHRLQGGVERIVGFASVVPRPPSGVPSALGLPRDTPCCTSQGSRGRPRIVYVGTHGQHTTSVVDFRVKLSGLNLTCNHPSTTRQWKGLSGRPQTAVLPHSPDFRLSLVDGTSAALREAPMPLSTSLATVKAAVNEGRATPPLAAAVLTSTPGPHRGPGDPLPLSPRASGARGNAASGCEAAPRPPTAPPGLRLDSARVPSRARLLSIPLRLRATPPPAHKETRALQEHEVLEGMRNPHVCNTPPRGQHFGAAVRALSHGTRLRRLPGPTRRPSPGTQTAGKLPPCRGGPRGLQGHLGPYGQSRLG